MKRGIVACCWRLASLVINPSTSFRKINMTKVIVEAWPLDGADA
jgi:hypothetical protein